MKIINRSRIYEIMRKHFFFVSFSYIAFVIFAVFSQEQIEQFAEFMPPELAGLKIVSIALFALLIVFVVFSLSVGVHVYKVLSSEYLRVWDTFVEGPTEKGERVVLSFSQIDYMGRKFKIMNIRNFGEMGKELEILAEEQIND